jgi:hypothetical protein
MHEIKDGMGSGLKLQIDEDHRARTLALALPEIALLSDQKSAVYTAILDFASVNNNTFVVGTVKNLDPEKRLVILGIELQALDYAGGTTVPAAASYWEVTRGEIWQSGGTAVTPEGVREGAQAPLVEIYDNNPTMSGTEHVLWKRYLGAVEGQIERPPLEPGLVLERGQAATVKITSDHTSGVAQAVVTFAMRKPL